MFGMNLSKSGKMAAMAGVAAALVFAQGALGDDKTFRGLRKGENVTRNNDAGSGRSASSVQPQSRGDRRDGGRSDGSRHDDRGGHDRGGGGSGYGNDRHHHSDHDRTRVNLNLNLGGSIGWAGSRYNRYDRPSRVVVSPAYPRHSDNHVVVVDRPYPSTVIVREPAYCPVPQTVIVRETNVYPEPTVIVREPEPRVIVQQTVYTGGYVALRERADEQFRAGRLSIAADLYREHLRSDPNDDYARRALGFALLTDNKYEDAIGVISTAYTQSPTLARSTIALGALPDGGGGLGARFQEVRSLAERTGNWQAYLTAAVIAQSIGNHDHAAAMTDRARSNGMNEQTGVEMSLAVTSVGR